MPSFSTCCGPGAATSRGSCAPKERRRRLDLGADTEIDAAAFEFAALTARQDVSLSSEEWLRAGKALRDLVVTPVVERLAAGHGTIYLCPDAALAAVPFAALPGKEVRPLPVDDYLLVQVTMAQDLVPWPDAGRSGKGALLVGAVDFGRAVEATGETPVEPAGGGVAVLDRAPRGRTFLPLPETRAEVDFARGLLGDAAVLTGAEATEARLRAAVRGQAAGSTWPRTGSCAMT